MRLCGGGSMGTASGSGTERSKRPSPVEAEPAAVGGEVDADEGDADGLRLRPAATAASSVPTLGPSGDGRAGASSRAAARAATSPCRARPAGRRTRASGAGARPGRAAPRRSGAPGRGGPRAAAARPPRGGRPAGPRAPRPPVPGRRRGASRRRAPGGHRGPRRAGRTWLVSRLRPGASEAVAQADLVHVRQRGGLWHARRSPGSACAQLRPMPYVRSLISPSSSW